MKNLRTQVIALLALLTGCAGNEPAGPADTFSYSMYITNDSGMQSFMLGDRRSMAIRVNGAYSTRSGDIVSNRPGDEIPVNLSPTVNGGYWATFLPSENPTAEFSIRVYDQGVPLAMREDHCHLIWQRLSVIKRPLPSDAIVLAPAFIGLEPDNRACRFRRRF